MFKCKNCNNDMTMDEQMNFHCGNCGTSVVRSRPSLVSKMANFAKATMNHVATGMHGVSNDDFEKRLDICKSCEFLDNLNKDNPSCVKCGCLLNIKLSWASEGCPVGKWPPVARGKGCGGCGRRQKKSQSFMIIVYL